MGSDPSTKPSPSTKSSPSGGSGRSPGSPRPAAPTSRKTPAPRPRNPEALHRLAVEVSRRRFTSEYIARMQAEIHHQSLVLSRTLDRPNFTKLGRDDVARMIRLYDERFFGGQVLQAAEAEGLRFGISSRMTRIAGKLVTHYADGNRDGPRRFELVLSSTLLFQTFDELNRPVEVTGRTCRDRLEAMQRVAEHEMVHLVEMLVWNNGNCSGARFQSIAHRYFGHTDYRHDLITQRERAARIYDLRVGDRVAFRHQRGILRGRINRITRRATVLVPDPAGERFCDGNRYVRYYVPLDQLTKIV